MYTGLKAGLAIKAKATQLNEHCRISAGTTGYVCRADAMGISIYLNVIPYGLEILVTSPEVFAFNFDEDHTRFDNANYSRQHHFAKRYPESLQ